MTAAEENLVAIADVDDARLAAAATKVARLGGRPKPFFDYRRMFDAVHKDIDAVFIATPDHHHAPASMMAMQLGKHVFCEKPLCHDIGQARALAAAARKSKVVTQMGNQGHCAEGYRRLCPHEGHHVDRQLRQQSADRTGGGAAGISATQAEHPPDQGDAFRPFP
jgi:predicted dehydrogenase